MRSRWLQIRGDPSVRRFVFDQARVANEFDRHIEEVLARIEILLLGHGVFHAKVHFSTGQVTLWLLNDPLRYRVHVTEEFLDPELCRIYPCSSYTGEAIVPSPEIPKILGEFKRLRSLDNHIYLRAGSLNVVNGLVGLNFSCDGSHYLNYADFLTHARELYG
ncbi:MAG: hypothetical protein Q7J84_08805 [Sulfuricaulis sp.]|nr:hypothetical protein [Sulfuricaulis sp.]